MRTSSSPTVLVGLSSGVDSSVAAWLLKQQGYTVIGVTLALAEPGIAASSRSCCSPSLMAKAKAVADHLRVPHYAFDVRTEFRDRVIEYFVSDYAAGRTPNPCAKCNSRVRFDALLRLAERFGAQCVATGHYARVGGRGKSLCRGRDRTKDQSYVLAEVDPETLSRCLFPLGSLVKEEVRAMADQAGLMELVSPESQDICFVPSRGYREFLKDRLGERPGDVVDDQGNVVARHTGTYNYTIGQKRGLGHGGSRTLYVSALDASTSEVRVGTEECATTKTLMFEVSARHSEPSDARVSVQVRSGGNAIPGTLYGPDKVIFDRGELGVAPGQTLVIYDDEEVVLGGTILSTSSAAPRTLRGAEEA